MKKMIALLLCLIVVCATVSALAADPEWVARYSNTELYSNTPDGHNKYIRNAQTDFNTQGSYGLTVDGYYGTKTKAAAVSFQKAHKLTADGRTGPGTKAKLWAYAP